MRLTIGITAIVFLLINSVILTPQRQRSRQQQQRINGAQTRLQDDADIEKKVDEIFSQPSSKTPFDQFVTPDPTYVPTSTPQILTNQNQQKCTCVPYHKCDPNSNKVKSSDDATPDEDARVGYGLIDIRFQSDLRECEEILDVCCIDEAKTDETVPPPPPPSTTPTRAAGCGIRNVGGIDFQLVGANDNEAGFGEFPWTVAIIRIDDDACICGGSLIHPKAILTGNHCVKEYIYRANDLKIRAGEWDTQTTKERLPYQERTVSRIFSHQNYNDKSLAFDFAVVELEDPFQLDDHINTICLPSPSHVPNNQDCFASGWGKDNFGKAGRYSVIMKKVPLPIVDFNTCQQALQNTRLTEKFRLDGSFICAGGQPGVDTCQGDGGAPLVCPVGRPNENRYAQNGIVAWGIGCKESHPAVYANVPLVRSWIDEKMNLIGLGTQYYTQP